MPLDISSNAILEKNKLTSDNVWLLLLKVTYPGEAAVRVCLNNDTVVWNSQTFLPAIFSLSGLSETKDAEVPNITLRFVDLNRVVMPFLEEYAGGVGAEVVMYVVNSNYLGNPVPELTETMEILSCSVDHSNVITFALGAENLANRRLPENRYLKNYCRFDFKSALCGYTGGETDCNRTLVRCAGLNNKSRFGGFPGVGMKGFILG